MRNNEYYQEYHLQDTAVERLSQKISQNKATKGLTVKRKFEAVLGILFFGMVIIPTIIGTLVQSGHLAPFTPSFMEVKQEPVVEQPQKPVESPVSPPIAIQSIKVATGGNPVKIGASDKQNEMIAYAWEISKDKNFIYTIESESGWVLEKVSGYNSNGTRDWGLGQISAYWHPEIVNDPRFQNNDWRWELSTVYKLYKGGTKFWGAERLKKDKNFYNAVAKNFIWN